MDAFLLGHGVQGLFTISTLFIIYYYKQKKNCITKFILVLIQMSFVYHVTVRNRKIYFSNVLICSI